MAKVGGIMECPLCKDKDQCENLVTILNTGSSESNISGVSIGGSIGLNRSGSLNAGISQYSGYTQNNLVKLVKPPLRPLTFLFGKEIYIYFILFGFFLMLIPPMSGDFSVFSIIITELIGLAIVSFSIKYYIKEKETIDKVNELSHKHLVPLWNLALDYWHTLYLCKRDFIIFDPESNEYCQADQLESFIKKKFKYDSSSLQTFHGVIDALNQLGVYP